MCRITKVGFTLLSWQHCVFRLSLLSASCLTHKLLHSLDLMSRLGFCNILSPSLHVSVSSQLSSGLLPSLSVMQTEAGICRQELLRICSRGKVLLFSILEPAGRCNLNLGLLGRLQARQRVSAVACLANINSNLVEKLLINRLLFAVALDWQKRNSLEKTIIFVKLEFLETRGKGNYYTLYSSVKNAAQSRHQSA